MERDAADALARTLMEAHGLRRWSFGFNHGRRQLGVCRYDRQRIELSVHLVDGNSESAVRETLLHEIAHALAGPRAGHGPKWKAMCMRVGAKPQRLDHEATMPQGRWRAKCPACGEAYHRHRRPTARRTYHCRACGPQRGRLRFLDHGGSGVSAPGSILPER